MSATDEMFRLLDERGVAYTRANATGGTLFIVVTSEEYYFILVRDNNAGIEMWSRDLTPEQAIEATLGPQITGDTSDGYHTFNELYHHRAVLFSVIVRDHPELAWKSKRHHDGTMYDDMFIVGIETPQGQATYHYDIEPYWEMFDCKELERAPEWDGHTPDQAIERIATLGRGTCKEVKIDRYFRGCGECGYIWEHMYGVGFQVGPRFCPRCGCEVTRDEQ